MLVNQKLLPWLVSPSGDGSKWWWDFTIGYLDSKVALGKKYRYVNNHSGSDFDFYYISIWWSYVQYSALADNIKHELP